MDALLERLRRERDEQITFYEQTLQQAEAGGRDLVEAELANVTAARQRVAAIDAQLAPLVAFEEARAAGAELLGRVPGHGRAGADPEAHRRAAAATGALTSAAEHFGYRSPGQFVLDRLRARGVPTWGWQPDAAAGERVANVQRHMLANQVTGDTPGILPVPIIGPIVDTLDGSRPFMTSLGVKPLGSIPGTSFTRPKITQHTQAGKQAAEKTPLTSRKMVISPVTFPKETFGGYVDISRQDIDWSSPAAWDALLTDLAKVYGLEAETATVAKFIAGLAPANTVTLPGATPTLEEWMLALYDAAGKAYQGCGALPDRYWCSIDMWGKLGALTDVARIQSPPAGSAGMGDSGLSRFSGNVLDLPRIVVPTMAPGSIVIGNSQYFEVYEDQLGVISAVEPALLGVEVAYGGYVASNFLEPLGFANLVVPPPIP